MKVGKLIVVSLLFLSVAYISGGNLYSAESELEKEVELLKSRFSDLEKRYTEVEKQVNIDKAEISEVTTEIHDYATKLDRLQNTILFQPGVQPAFELEGFRLGMGGTFIAQATNNANAEGSGKKDKAAGSVKGTMELQKVFSDVEGQAFMGLQAGNGDGLDDSLVLYSGVDNNAFSDGNIDLHEFWYEQAFFDKTTILTVGKVSFWAYYDQNRVAGSDARQFISVVFNSNPVIDAPLNSLGFNVAVIPADWIELNYMLKNADGDELSDMADRLFNVGQVALKPKIGGLTGIYRFFAFYNKAAHTKWKDASQTNEASYGIGISIDQDLSDVFAVFGRYDWTNPKVYNPDNKAVDGTVYSLEQGWSLGIQAKGIPWGREKDAAGLAVGQIMASGDYKDVTGADGKDEGHLEAYYRYQVNPYFGVSPDLQYVWNSFGKDVSDNTSAVFVASLRCHVDY